LSNQGEYIIAGGQIEISGRIQNENYSQRHGVIELSEGTLRVGLMGENSGQASLINRSLIAAISGENHIYGNIGNEQDGQLTVTNNSLLMFHNDVVGQYSSTISVYAGSTVIFLQDLTLNGGTLLADLTGAEGFGHVEVVGDFNFYGSLQVQLDENYVPQAGDSFSIAKVSGSFGGTPNLDLLPVLSEGLSWETTFDAHELLLNVIETPPLTGDFDGDGDVDGRDFLAWQRNPSGGDLADWQNNYGVGGVIAASTAVPEPGAWILTMGMGIVWCVVQRKYRV
jgi:hypothetical protein